MKITEYEDLSHTYASESIGYYSITLEEINRFYLAIEKPKSKSVFTKQILKLQKEKEETDRKYAKDLATIKANSFDCENNYPKLLEVIEQNFK